jgi:hypothetical protein
MKAVVASLFAAFLVVMPLSASSDDSKTLENTKGQVAYGPANPGTNPLAPKGRTGLNDADWATTGANSQATITLPDSSQVLIGQNSSVQMTSFTAGDVAAARFTISVGKVRFKVNHPQGAKADYKFQTTTGQIAVRGTEGDIFLNSNGGLQVNVYAVSNPALPVQVTLVNGQVFTLAAGQSLVAGAVAGAVTASVTGVSQGLYQPFSEFPAPANAGSLGIAGATGATTAAATTAVAAGAATAAAAVAVASSTKPTPAPTATPTLAPSPQPSTTSVPITVNTGSRTDPNNGHRPGPRPSPLP